jgi:ferritin heavy chain
MSQIRQNYHDESEKAINDQINLELTASYIYQGISFHFDRDDVALPGFSKFFSKNSEEEREHAEKLMKYQNSRGGRIVLAPVAAPTKTDFATGLEAMQYALELEKKVNDSLLNVHVIASKHGDAHLTDYLEGEFLDEQVKSIKELGCHITQLKRVGAGLGEYKYDKHLHD